MSDLTDFGIIYFYRAHIWQIATKQKIPPRSIGAGCAFVKRAFTAVRRSISARETEMVDISQNVVYNAKVPRNEEEEGYLP